MSGLIVLAWAAIRLLDRCVGVGEWTMQAPTILKCTTHHHVYKWLDCLLRYACLCHSILTEMVSEG